MKKLFRALFLPAMLYGCHPKDEGHQRMEPPKDFSSIVDHRNISIDSVKAIMAQTGKPLVLYFSGYACVNARRIEAELLQDPSIREGLEKTQLVEFMVDEKTPLPGEEKYVSSFDGDSVVNVGQRGMEIQLVFRKISQPCFLKVNAALQVLDSLDYISPREKRAEFFRK